MARVLRRHPARLADRDGARSGAASVLDKNDPKDAAVILEMLKQGRVQRFVDPMLAGHHDVQEVSTMGGFGGDGGNAVIAGLVVTSTDTPDGSISAIKTGDFTAAGNGGAGGNAIGGQPGGAKVAEAAFGATTSSWRSSRRRASSPARFMT